jgi:hypothetical protein
MDRSLQSVIGGPSGLLRRCGRYSLTIAGGRMWRQSADAFLGPSPRGATQRAGRGWLSYSDALNSFVGTTVPASAWADRGRTRD